MVGLIFGIKVIGDSDEIVLLFLDCGIYFKLVNCCVCISFMSSNL